MRKFIASCLIYLANYSSRLAWKISPTFEVRYFQQQPMIIMCGIQDPNNFNISSMEGE